MPLAIQTNKQQGKEDRIMAVENKKGFKWRGLATFMLVLGILVEIVSGVVLYITPLGRFANWTNWTLLGLNKHEWASIHTVFGYFLLIIIGLHLYFNWRVLLHFFWSKLHSSFNLKREFIVAAAVVAMVFAGILWNIPPFSAAVLAPDSASADDLCASDVNDDGIIDGLDLQGFVNLVLGS